MVVGEHDRTRLAIGLDDVLDDLGDLGGLATVHAHANLLGLVGEHVHEARVRKPVGTTRRRVLRVVEGLDVLRDILMPQLP